MSNASESFVPPNSGENLKNISLDKIQFVIVCFYCQKQKPGKHYYQVSRKTIGSSKTNGFECDLCDQCFKQLFDVYLEKDTVQKCPICEENIKSFTNYITIQEVNDDFFYGPYMEYHPKCFKSMCTISFYKKLIS